MKKSESIKCLSEALLSFNNDVEKIKKDAQNPFFKSSYASLSNILNEIKEPLIKNKLVITQHPTGENKLATILIHTESGEFIESTFKLMPVKQDPQGQGSAITYARRYALCSILGLNVDDDDGNIASNNLKSKTPSIFKPTGAESIKTCPLCGKEHQGQYPKCIECWKAEKDGTKITKTKSIKVPSNSQEPF